MAKNVIIGILSLLVVALIADSVWLHINCCRQQENIAALAHAGDFRFTSEGKLVLNDARAAVKCSPLPPVCTHRTHPLTRRSPAIATTRYLS